LSPTCPVVPIFLVSIAHPVGLSRYWIHLLALKFFSPALHFGTYRGATVVQMFVFPTLFTPAQYIAELGSACFLCAASSLAVIFQLAYGILDYCFRINNVSGHPEVTFCSTISIIPREVYKNIISITRDICCVCSYENAIDIEFD